MKKLKTLNMKIWKVSYCLQSIRVKIQYCLLEVTEFILESKIFKLEIHLEQLKIDWYYLVFNYF